MRYRQLYLFSPLVLAAAATLASWGCSASGKSNTSDNEPSGAGAGDSGDPGGPGSGTGGNSNPVGSGEGGTFITLDGGADGSLAQDSACAATSKEAEFVPLDIVVLLDRSGSMTGSNWDGATEALKSYVSSPDATGVSVGIVYFPIDFPPDDQSCTYTHYDNPVVPIGELPGNTPALIESIDTEDPDGGGTPMYGALRGALVTATKHQDAHPERKVIVVFASDGDPNSCEGTPGTPVNADTIPVIANLAKSALNYNGVQTYVIAISGAILQNLNQIAMSGGTGQALDCTQNINLFLDKMKEIQSKSIACDFPVPEPPVGQEFDKDLVAVSFIPSDPPSLETQVPRAENYVDCGNKPGWYYDDNTKPTKILLCPASCTTVQADKKAKVNVLFGCSPDIN